ncbi:uncharacterized protein E0L32_003138 [Thyridium curvatum]|uniref:Ubiquitin carboxyl-terminal hydrolase n=1 Tax=Thyridium curvatum TaxID=1093900 RepID=A0A507B310_9PEZI|nr:uncharacterized protein E0L32_003138 [Thyridium curvatum]TPX17495.1 hypothetical protein E0L32_003138 [Thyridium curvatum]
MPEKSLTAVTYAAGASLAAITLIYVFAPTYFLDGDPNGSSSSSAGGAASSLFSGRKKGVVGLANAANDCFINAVLQALAGLGDLRLYLIRETHRRNLDDKWIYTTAVPDDVNGSSLTEGGVIPQKPMPAWKVEGLQGGIVTRGLKEVLDQLNERPIYKKTISALPFVRVLEVAFRQRISRQQQDAQEFLQVVAERLCDEYHAGRRARDYAREKFDSSGASASSLSIPDRSNNVTPPELRSAADEIKHASQPNGGALVPPSAENGDDDEEEGFPMEGKISSQIECLTCGFKPRPSEQTFCTLTLNVPQVSSTTLNACFDSMFKTEYIDDFRCERCRLMHAKQTLEAQLTKITAAAKTTPANEHELALLRDSIAKLDEAIATDPERAPDGVAMPDPRSAPTSRIARHIQLTRFPKIIAIHLSRSIYDERQSLKNSAKVAFPERLPLGGILSQRRYKLLGLVTHKGSHHSGHYESFRRQNLYPAYSNPNTFAPSGVYTPSATPAPTPRIGGGANTPRSISSNGATPADGGGGSPLASTPDLTAISSSPSPSSPSPSAEHLPDASLAPAHQENKHLRHVAGSGSSNGLSSSSSSSSSPQRKAAPTSAPRTEDKERDKDKDAADTVSLRSVARSTLSRISLSGSRPGSRSGSRSASKSRPSSGAGAGAGGDGDVPAPPPPPAGVTPAAPAAAKPRRHRKTTDRWWRISDEKVKEASTRDVLGMQREVYLLFYELERSH